MCSSDLSTCLAELLKKQGYNSTYFMSQTESFERSPKILENLGYEEFYSADSMDKEGFEQTNYFGYEDEIMLEPSRKWLEQQKKSDRPFLATYLTSAPHHDYLAPSKRHGREVGRGYLSVKVGASLCGLRPRRRPPDGQATPRPP